MKKIFRINAPWRISEPVLDPISLVKSNPFISPYAADYDGIDRGIDHYRYMRILNDHYKYMNEQIVAAVQCDRLVNETDKEFKQRLLKEGYRAAVEFGIKKY